VDQASLPAAGLDEVEDEIAPGPSQAVARRGQIQREGKGEGFVSQGAERRRHRLDLHEHVLLVRRGAGFDAAVKNDGFHERLTASKTPAPRRMP
jgi:hypothetical protein